jgi:NADP-dependent 3-hydroxy acid dehydrogenase YdfG
MSNNIEGKIVVISGASSGLGEATSQPNRHASVARRSAALIKAIAEGTSLEGQRALGALDRQLGGCGQIPRMPFCEVT